MQRLESIKKDLQNTLHSELGSIQYVQYGLS